MGTWNTGLFSNDTTSDVRDTYIQFLKEQLSNEDAYQRTYDEYKELIGTEEEPLFWYAIAEAQWNAGRLIPEVRDRALDCIQKKGGIFIWEQNLIGGARWESTLQKLEEKIKSPMPPEKKYSKPIEFERNPWNTGDVYAYQFHTNKAKENGLDGKYILLQKVGNVEYFKGITFSAIQVFNRIFDSIPCLDMLVGLRVLPLVYSPMTEGYPSDIADYIPTFEWYMKATMIYEKKNDYPKCHLKFIGNKKLPEKHYAGNDFTDFYWCKNGMDDWLIDYYLSWLNVKF